MVHWKRAVRCSAAQVTHGSSAQLGSARSVRRAREPQTSTRRAAPFGAAQKLGARKQASRRRVCPIQLDSFQFVRLAGFVCYRARLLFRRRRQKHRLLNKQSRPTHTYADKVARLARSLSVCLAPPATRQQKAPQRFLRLPFTRLFIDLDREVTTSARGSSCRLRVKEKKKSNYKQLSTARKQPHKDSCLH